MELCTLKSLGWIKNKTNYANVDMINADIITADINSLPASVASQLSIDAVWACALPLAQHLSYAWCPQAYTIKQLEALGTVAEAAFSLQCVGDMLKSACGTYVDQTYLEPIRASLATTTATTPMG
jgi:hypothetical protein